MKATTLLISFFLLIMLACTPNSDKSAEITPQDSIKVFEYVYPNNTSDLIENHYLILTFGKDSTYGRYYGTSDDFDQGREGYLPGFFVADILDLTIQDDSIKFKVKVTNDDMFTKAIDLKIKNSAEARLNNYEQWDIGLSSEEKEYNGVIKGDTILIKENRDIRHYVRMRDN